ncbi:hypothetical protein ACU4GI_19470 [Cupriavidus basilensis]
MDDLLDASASPAGRRKLAAVSRTGSKVHDMDVARHDGATPGF